jgi:uncharacterized integral membrane protein
MPDVQVSGHRFQLSWRMIVGGVIAVLALILILQNTHDVQIHVFFWHADRPLWLWLLLLFVAGFIVGSLFPWANLLARRHPKGNAPGQPSAA